VIIDNISNKLDIKCHIKKQGNLIHLKLFRMEIEREK
jgi:hypothetical protein